MPLNGNMRNDLLCWTRQVFNCESLLGDDSFADFNGKTFTSAIEIATDGSVFVTGMSRCPTAEDEYTIDNSGDMFVASGAV